MDGNVKGSRIADWVARVRLLSGLLFAAAVTFGCCCVPSPPTACTNIEATVAYYYRYKDATPDQSDIAFIEVLPPGPRCIVPSAKRAPVFPDSAVTGSVQSGVMKIDIPDSRYVDIRNKATIAVYYKGDPANVGRVPVAIEDLRNLSRTIETVSVFDTGSPGCGSCPTIMCDGYACCKRPPC